MTSEHLRVWISRARINNTLRSRSSNIKSQNDFFSQTKTPVRLLAKPDIYHLPPQYLKRGVEKKNYSKYNKSYQTHNTVGYRTQGMHRRCGCHNHPSPHPILNGGTGQGNFHFPGSGHLSTRQPLWRVHVPDSWNTLELAS